MKSYILAFIALFLMCQCTSNKEKCFLKGQELNKNIFHPQFLEIVNSYVSSHKEFDAYIVISSSEIAKAFDKLNVQMTKYYVMPATLSYRVVYSEDNEMAYRYLAYDDDLALYICVCGKPVYIKSDIDYLSYRILPNDKIIPRITTSNKKGNIWSFHRYKNKFKIDSKNVESGRDWPGKILKVKKQCDLQLVR